AVKEFSVVCCGLVKSAKAFTHCDRPRNFDVGELPACTWIVTQPYSPVQYPRVLSTLALLSPLLLSMPTGVSPAAFVVMHGTFCCDTRPVGFSAAAMYVAAVERMLTSDACSTLVSAPASFCQTKAIRSGVPSPVKYPKPWTRVGVSM